MKIFPSLYPQPNRIVSNDHLRRAAAQTVETAQPNVSKTAPPSRAEAIEEIQRIVPPERRSATREVSGQGQPPAIKGQSLPLSALLSAEETEMLQKLFPSSATDQTSVAHGSPGSGKVAAYLPNGAVEADDGIAIGKLVDIRS
jgi:hypothetical protein